MVILVKRVGLRENLCQKRKSTKNLFRTDYSIKEFSKTVQKKRIMGKACSRGVRV
jgi:hypothetical protein